MRKLKRLSVLAVVALLSIILLAACGSSSENASGDGEKGGNVLEDIKDRDKIIFGVKYDTRLFGLKDPASGEVEGFDIDIAKQIAKEIVGDETKVEFVEVTSKTRIPLLNKGDIDAIIATMTISEERKKEVDFSDVYFEAGQSLLVKKGSPIESVDDLTKDTTVLAVKGSTSTDNIREAAPDAQVLEFENYQEAFTALKSGQGDTLTTDNSILLGMASEDDSFELVGGTFTDEPYGVAVKKGQKELVDAINDALTAMKDNGKYDEIYNEWIDME
ncbi:transporter substrate-binding domain-containing protein [Oceanobacillus sp. 143]|uniref:Amino acid ABC transporter substrate-binding protein n=1 Tax=Oceanobacillus zhaokaii TaxID=2052660 RepID=A0A345PL41_9BACI|nr:transporter substrate-binding domain-containing protein [Oceanobacillus zhaokaii]AXI10721.1 amino acid ABC transporter substrate-binding protein [Oceanobacillus zhaokaii]QGS69654.1 transporter substrate-binding domain-containing protein [Oceanobacillus sp. 143]